MMGQVRVTARVSGPFGSELVEFVADTGATLTALPRGIADFLGLIPLRDDPVRLAGGFRVTGSRGRDAFGRPPLRQRTRHLHRRGLLCSLHPA